MVAKFVNTYQCPSCLRKYAEKHYKNISNNLPLMPENQRCTFAVNSFNPSSGLSLCNHKLALVGKTLMPCYREYFQKDECLEYFTRKSMEELCS